MKTLTSILYLLAVALIASAAFGVEAKADKPTIKIGINMGLSGNSESDFMKVVQKSFLMEEKELNARPEAPYQYKLFFEDNMWTARGAVLATERMISVNNVDAVIVLADYAFGPTTPIAKRKQIANVALAWGADKADGKYNFLLGTDEIVYAKSFYSVVRNSPLKTGILTVRQSATPAFVDEMQRLAKADGKPEFPVTFINSESVDFRTVILKLNKEEKIEQLVLILYGNDLAKFMYQMQQSDYRPAFVMMVDGLKDIPNRDILLKKGAVVALDGIPNEEFSQRYKEFAKEEPNQWSCFGYDCLKLIAESIEAAPASKDPLHIRIAQAIAQRKSFNGTSGTYTQNKGVFEKPPLLFRLTATGEEPFTPDNL